MKRLRLLAVLLAGLLMANAYAANPIVKGWYADPDIVVFGDRYWVYPTYSNYYQETFMDAFSSPDLVHWTKHPRIVTTQSIKWAEKAMWAPCAVEKDGRYYLFFAANDIKPGEVGGIGVAVADAPAGPFKDLLGKPLIDQHYNGAQPIDQAVFQNPKDGQWYIVYGGWRHCNLAKLGDDFKSLIPFDDGKVVHEITPEGYVEGPMMFFRGGKVYFMWSEGGWGDDTYQVAYAIGDGIEGPFKRIGTAIEKNPAVATGAGHHSILHIPGTGDYYMAYHRRPPGEIEANHRVTAIDKMEFNPDGTIKPVVMTDAGVEPRPLKP